MSCPANNQHSVSKRLQAELMTLMTSGDKGISAFPDGDDLFHWVATISGASSTVYEGLEFKLRLEFTTQYPFSPPLVRFTSPCFHPNVDQQGNICLDILKEKWSASYDVRALLLSIQSLLGEPNNNSPLNAQAADMWKDPVKYRQSVLERCASCLRQS